MRNCVILQARKYSNFNEACIEKFRDNCINRKSMCEYTILPHKALTVCSIFYRSTVIKTD